MRLVRTTAAVLLMGALFLGGSATIADSATPIGNGFCAAGEFCVGKNDTGLPWADWTGEAPVPVLNDWRYNGYPTDSPNDDGEQVLNGDEQAHIIYEDPDYDTPSSCFPTTYFDSDMKGRENNDSSFAQYVGTC